MKNTLKRICHISDTHIRNLKFHEEYRHVFKEIYDSLKQESPDYIVHTGDLAHTKTQLSPEYFEVASNFLKSLADIAPTILILGNHDGNLKNSNRQDAITPIIEALSHPNIKLLKESQEYTPEEGLTFNVLSVFDRDNWKKPTNPESINIALYHGAIVGSLVATGFSLDHGEDDISIFRDFDYAMLGDIHRTQHLDEAKRIWYSGSTVQQNHGEYRLKGYLMWNIQSKDKHSVTKRLFQSPRPFITVNVTEDGKLPNVDVPRNARLRLICEQNIPRARLIRLQDYAQAKWSPLSVSVVNKSLKSSPENSLTRPGSIRDKAVFEKHMEAFLESKKASKEVSERAMEIARSYHQVHLGLDTSRNVTWKLKSMTWDYLFNYGKGNSIDFTKLNGLVGIFGKNYSGKSSIIDSALFGLFNTTSKGERKNVHVINQNQESAKCNIEFEIGDDTYTIARNIERTKASAKTDLDFSLMSLGITPESKNGTTRNETDAKIQSTIGTYADFTMTSLSTQHNSMGFINEGSTKRKSILAKFLDLEIFEEMNKSVKKESAEMRGRIKHLNSIEWEKKLKRSESEMVEIESEIVSKQAETVKHNARLDVLKEERDIINSQVMAASKRDIDIDDLRRCRLKTQGCLKKALQDKSDMDRSIIEKDILFASLSDKEETCKSLSLNAELKLKELEKVKKELLAAKESLRRLKNIESHLQKDIDTLHDHKYDPECSFCSDNKFVKSAEAAKVEIVSVRSEIEITSSRYAEIQASILEFGEGYLLKEVKEYDSLCDSKNRLKRDLQTLSAKSESLGSKILLYQHRIPKFDEDISYYEENLDAYENISSLNRDLFAINKTILLKEKACDKCNKALLELMSEKGSTRRTISDSREGILKVKEAECDYIAYDLFAQATHTNGISYGIIKSMLSIINSEISSILSSIVDFEIMIADDGDSLEIYLKHPKFDPRPLSMGSGAEKTLASMAIRLALISVSSLPKSDFFILDEPATALDADHMDGFVRLLQMVKSHFKTVLLITHLENLKDVVDTSIDIGKIDGYAKISI